MKVRRGDIVLIDYPYSDRTGSKLRPALVVQSDGLNSRIDDTILAAVSRSAHRASSTQLFVDVSTPNGLATGLWHNSMIQCENLLTCDQRLIVHTIGRLPANLQQDVDACLRATLDLYPT